MRDDELAVLEHLPNVQELLSLYDCRHFGGALVGASVKLEWSDKMTRCAGICMLRSRKMTNEREVIIRLSRPLLQFRPFSDTIDTLLHEMIHAFYFIRQGRASLDRDGHGPDFCALMQKINAAEGSHITVHHSFHHEVEHYKKHVWRCNGACRDRAPFFGWVRRTMNRPPQPADSWWNSHKSSCSGQFTKQPPGAEENHEPGNSSKVKVFKGKGRTWSDVSRTNNPIILPSSSGTLSSAAIASNSEQDKKSKITHYFVIDD